MIKTSKYKVFFEHLNLMGLIDRLLSSRGLRDGSCLLNSFRRVGEEEKKGESLCGVTYCYLENLEGKLINMGKAKFSTNEKYNKKGGRKTSLKDAVSVLPRSERTEIWNAYNNRK